MPAPLKFLQFLLRDVMIFIHAGRGLEGDALEDQQRTNCQAYGHNKFLNK